MARFASRSVCVYEHEGGTCASLTIGSRIAVAATSSNTCKEERIDVGEICKHV